MPAVYYRTHTDTHQTYISLSLPLSLSPSLSLSLYIVHSHLNLSLLFFVATMMSHIVRKKLLSSATSSSSLLTRISPIIPNFTRSASRKLVHSRFFTSRCINHDPKSELVSSFESFSPSFITDKFL